MNEYAKTFVIEIPGQEPQLVTPVKGKLNTTSEEFFNQLAKILSEKPDEISKTTKS